MLESFLNFLDFFLDQNTALLGKGTWIVAEIESKTVSAILARIVGAGDIVILCQENNNFELFRIIQNLFWYRMRFYIPHKKGDELLGL